MSFWIRHSKKNKQIKQDMYFTKPVELSLFCSAYTRDLDQQIKALTRILHAMENGDGIL